MDYKKALLHAKSLYLYVNEKEHLVKGKYSVEAVSHDKKKVLCEVVDDHMVEEPSDHKDIRLRGFDLNILDKDEEVVVIEGCSEPYLPMLIKLWPEDWISQLKKMNLKLDEENGKALNKGNVRYQNVC